MVNPREILAELTEFLNAIDSGTCARDEKARIKSKRLGNSVAILELVHQENRHRPGPEEQAAIDVVLKEARRVLTEILKRLASPPH